jgi:hypothetical protein
VAAVRTVTALHRFDQAQLLVISHIKGGFEHRLLIYFDLDHILTTILDKIVFFNITIHLGKTYLVSFLYILFFAKSLCCARDRSAGEQIDIFFICLTHAIAPTKVNIHQTLDFVSESNASELWLVIELH